MDRLHIIHDIALCLTSRLDVKSTEEFVAAYLDIRDMVEPVYELLAGDDDYWE